MRLALVGNGKMGQAIASLAAGRGHEIVATIGSADNSGGRALTAQRLAGVDLALEFTRPDAAAGNLVRLAELGLSVVTGTTGWTGQLPRVARAVAAAGTGLLHSPNFSIGAQLFLRAARDLAARCTGRREFEGFVVEAHHAAKVDAPSGTANRLREVLRQADPARDFPVTSIRAGFIPGTHTVAYDAPYETIRLTHEARGRQAFAAGALAAAEWLQGRRGVYTLEQMLFGDEP